MTSSSRRAGLSVQAFLIALLITGLLAAALPASADDRVPIPPRSATTSPESGKSGSDRDSVTIAPFPDESRSGDADEPASAPGSSATAPSVGRENVRSLGWTGETCAPGRYFSINRDGQYWAGTVSGTAARPQVSQVGAMPIQPWSGTGARSGGVAYSPANALAVSPEGTFYSTQMWADDRGSTTQWYVNIFRTQAGETSGTQVWSNRLVDTGWRDPSGTTKTFRVVGGAYDVRARAFVFMNVRELSPGRWGIDVFRYIDNQAPRLASTILIPGNGALLNGDIAYDVNGNFYALTSDGNTGEARLFTVRAADMEKANGGTISPSLVSGIGAAYNGWNYNGISFNSDGTILVQSTANGQQSYSNLIVLDPNTFKPVGPSTQIPVVSGSDLASCQTPGTITLVKNIAERAQPDDQFTLSVSRKDGTGGVLASATTNGHTTGIQSPVAGPVLVLAGTEYALAERTNRKAAEADYSSAYECRADATGAVIASGRGTAFTLRAPADKNGAGIDTTCVITNTATPKVKVNKTVQPASGSTVNPGQKVDYTITFTNEFASGPATVDSVDLLTDVLDDADLDEDSLTADGPLRAAFDRDRIHITGEVPAKSSRTVTYSVTVRDTEHLGDRNLRNLVVPLTDTDEPVCEAGNCTDNPVADAAWTLRKTADPASGSEVGPGDTIVYTVTATASRGVVPDAVITDDLGEVLDSAAFEAGSAQLRLDDGESVAVADPVGNRLATEAFRLSAGQTAVLSYRVTIHDDAWARTLTNLVWGTGASPPQACTPEGPCRTEHTTPVKSLVLPAAGGWGNGWILLAGGVLLAATLLTALVLRVRRARG